MMQRKSKQNLMKCVLLLFVQLYVTCIGEVIHNVHADGLYDNGSLNVTFGTNLFSLELYKILSDESPKESLFLSPLSLQLLLGLVHSGAENETANEIAKTMHVSNNKHHLVNGYKHLLHILKDPSLKIAMKMFVDNKFYIKKDFRDLAVNYFQTGIDKVDFQYSLNATNTINNWIEHSTNGTIKNLINNDTLNSYTAMVLINLIHFKMSWKVAFSTADTDKAKFFMTKTDVREVDMMYMSEVVLHYYHYNNLHTKILELPYKDDHFSMYIVLPDEISGLEAIENKLKEVLDAVSELHTKRPRQVDVLLPKFTLSQTTHFTDVLQMMGMKSMFSQQADFSGITDEPIVVSKVIQNSFIDVNEEGTEATAGTGMMISVRSGYVNEIFRADHPFLFLITKRITENHQHKPLIVFIGKYT